MPIFDGGGRRATNAYDALRAQEESEYERWRDLWRGNNPDKPYHRQAILDAARTGQPLDIAIMRVPSENLPRGKRWDLFDRVTVSPDGTIEFTRNDPAAWFEEEGLDLCPL